MGKMVRVMPMMLKQSEWLWPRLRLLRLLLQPVPVPVPARVQALAERPALQPELLLCGLAPPRVRLPPYEQVCEFCGGFAAEL